MCQCQHGLHHGHTCHLCGAGELLATNEAVLGLGPFGSWQLGIEGKWLSRGDGRTVRVVFERLKFKPVGIMGLPLPAWMPQVGENGGAYSLLGLPLPTTECRRQG